MKKITIGVATHKPYQMPSDSMYLPVQSGSEFHPKIEEYSQDNIGDHISGKNKNYSELTALYWIWKNVSADYKGLAHYRRHFSKDHNVNIFTQGTFNEVLDRATLESKLEKADIVLPKKRNYYIESIESHYNHTHYEQDLVVTRDVLEKIYPDYVEKYDEVLKRKSAHMFNMFVMSEEKFNSYCEWLFSVLFILEENLDISEYNDFHARVFGRVSEILLDVWIDKNNYSYEEIPVIFMENRSWLEKGTKFLKAKFKISRY
ncbi:DUF4422 domain-containing protein [Enterococcus asini]|uniref:DUF4422 domain-containing protein n=1 Tax=Enterococcus asini TaxID=57732 RepID=UPI0032E513C4